MTFRVGQKVVCVDDKSEGKYLKPGTAFKAGLDGLTKGEIYTVRRVAGAINNWIGPNIWVEEIIRPMGCHGMEPPYNAARFRPVQEQGMSILRSIAANPKQKIRELA